MTLSGRNRFVIAGIIWSLLIFVILGYFSLKSFSVFPLVEKQAINRPFGMLHSLIALFLKPQSYVPLFSIIISVLYSLITSIAIYFLFEKTQSPEILFFATFVLSLSLEIGRMALPLITYYDASLSYAVFTGKIILFSRLFGLFSLFLASVYAAGMDMQRYGFLLLLNFAVCLTLASGVPIDSMNWDTALTPRYGFANMFFFIELTIIIITVTSFFISIKNKSSKDYIFVSLGIFLVILGRDILLHADTFPELGISIPLLGVGTWMYCVYLHRYYLWL